MSRQLQLNNTSSSSPPEFSYPTNDSNSTTPSNPMNFYDELFGTIDDTKPFDDQIHDTINKMTEYDNDNMNTESSEIYDELTTLLSNIQRQYNSLQQEYRITHQYNQYNHKRYCEQHHQMLTVC